MSGTGDHSKRVSRICEAALERPQADRPAFLRRVCAGDETLLREVEQLLSWNADVAPLVAALAGDPIVPLSPLDTACTTQALSEPL